MEKVKSGKQLTALLCVFILMISLTPVYAKESRNKTEVDFEYLNSLDTPTANGEINNQAIRFAGWVVAKIQLTDVSYRLLNEQNIEVETGALQRSDRADVVAHIETNYPNQGYITDLSGFATYITLPAQGTYTLELWANNYCLDSVSFTYKEAEPWTPLSTDWQPVDRNGAVVRFGVMADVHIGAHDDVTQKSKGELEKLENALKAYHSIASDIDLLAFNGDNVEHGTEQQYKDFKTVVENNTKGWNSQMLYVMGDHEYFADRSSPEAYEQMRQRFIKQLGPLQQDIEINGYHFISSAYYASNMAGNEIGDYTLAEAFLKEKIAAASEEDPEKPIFVMVHRGFPMTTYYSRNTPKDGDNGHYTEEFQNFLKNYPQVVMFGSHTHEPLNHPEAIAQEDFTSVQTGVTGADMWYDETFENADYSQSLYGAGLQPYDRNNISQSLLVEVSEKNVVTIRRMDLYAGEYIGTPWVIDIPSVVQRKENFTYTRDRYNTNIFPEFPENAEVAISDQLNTSLTLTVPRALNAQTLEANGFVEKYFIDITNTRTEKTETRVYHPDYQNTRLNENFAMKIDALEPNSSYTFQIYGVNPAGVETNRLTCQATLGNPDYEKEDPYEADLLNVTFEDNTAADYSRFKAQIITHGEPVIAYDKDIKRNVASFNGIDDSFSYDFSDEKYSLLTSTMSNEVFVKINSYPTSYGDLVSSMHAAGMGWELDNTMQKMLYCVRSASLDTYVNVPVDITIGQWMHLMATYDGTAVRVYVNGVEAGATPMTGPIKHPTLANLQASGGSDATQQVFLSGDPDATGKQEAPVNCSISLARMYSNSLTGEQVRAIYKKLQEKDDDSNGSSSGGGSGGSVARPKVSITGTGGTAKLSSDGKTLTIAPSEGYQVKDVILNGVSKGTVNSLTGLKTSDQVVVTFVKITEVTKNETAPIFSDTVTHWSNKDVQYVTTRGLFTGTSETTFSPDALMTRGMLMAVLARYDGQSADSGNIWYEKAMAWAVSEGISDGTDPEGSITREQLVTMLYRYAGSPQVSSMDLLFSFTDAASVSSWAENSLNWAVKKSILSGKSGGFLDPKGNATRGEVAAILHRFILAQV